ncbi:DUF924 family protein [Hydrogenophaga sp. A37]|uniref:DUF924 family protein n=1 Tax=Hydrogenophaga sp. A37 TaxID=1945864 RepID=UPI00209B43B4|nr:DUF924 family protein [Hydrogenophaga sp. A37]
MTPLPPNLHPQDVLDFWLGDGMTRDWPSDNRNDLWFGGGAEQDALIRERFGALVEHALDGGLIDWEAPLHDRLALVLLLDQFTRNVHRGQPRAFAGDGRAQRLVMHTLALGQDTGLPCAARVFLYMPLMHAESQALQDECVLRFEKLRRTSPPELQATLSSNLRFAEQHNDIIQRFGRFPHRNAALGRVNTPEEAAFLTDGPRFGQ